MEPFKTAGVVVAVSFLIFVDTVVGGRRGRIFLRFAFSSSNTSKKDFVRGGGSDCGWSAPFSLIIILFSSSSSRFAMGIPIGAISPEE